MSRETELRGGVLLAIVVVLITSVLSWRWPVTGIICFLLAYTGGQAVFEQYGVLGPGAGPIRADTIAVAVAIMALLMRPKLYQPDRRIEVAMWVITIIIPIALWYIAPTPYEWAADTWRVLFWAPLFLGILRLREDEMSFLRKSFVGLVGLTGLLTIYIFVTNDLSLYGRLSSLRFSNPSAQGLTAVPIAILRIDLPGTYSFGAAALFVTLREFLVAGRRRRWLQRFFLGACLVGVVGAIFITMSRFAAVSVGLGLAAALALGSIRGLSPRVMALGVGACGLVVAISAYVAIRFPEATAQWQERFGSARESSSWTLRQENNETYVKMLTQRFAIIGHPGFERDNKIVGGYIDTIAPVALWWYYGVVAALVYVFIMLAIAGRLLGAVFARPHLPALPRATVAVWAGLFVCYNVNSLSGVYPQAFEWAFLVSYMTAEWLRACVNPIRPRSGDTAPAPMS
jgi:hypothetical protein